MKNEKEKLAAKSVTALKAAAKRLGGKLVTPDGKAKTKQQLINTIVMKQRLAGKSMGGNTTTKKVAKKTVAKKATVKKTMGQLPKAATYKGAPVFKDIPEYRVFLISQLGPTNTKGTRVKITDLYYPDSTIVNYGYKGNATSTAYEYLTGIGIRIIGRADNVLISKNTTLRIK